MTCLTNSSHQSSTVCWWYRHLPRCTVSWCWYADQLKQDLNKLSDCSIRWMDDGTKHQKLWGHIGHQEAKQDSTPVQTKQLYPVEATKYLGVTSMQAWDGRNTSTVSAKRLKSPWWIFYEPAGELIEIESHSHRRRMQNTSVDPWRNTLLYGIHQRSKTSTSYGDDQEKGSPIQVESIS